MPKKQKHCVVCGKPFKPGDKRGLFGWSSLACHQSCNTAYNRKEQRRIRGGK